MHDITHEQPEESAVAGDQFDRDFQHVLILVVQSLTTKLVAFNCYDHPETFACRLLPGAAPWIKPYRMQPI